jgi:hypothetical protein
MSEEIGLRYQHVLERITHAAGNAGRNPDMVRLVVVTKGHPLDAALRAVQAGARLLGENYAEEGAEKALGMGEVPGLEWHMIGHVQSRKAKLVCDHFTCVHSLDSLKLAERLNRLAGERGKRLPVLLECNVSGEASKYGFDAAREQDWPALAAQLEALQVCTNLEVRGLMTMAPYGSEPEAARPIFRKLRRLREALQQRLPELCWEELSMGMSGDFEAAIQEGATLVRLGEAILGPRVNQPGA